MRKKGGPEFECLWVKHSVLPHVTDQLYYINLYRVQIAMRTTYTHNFSNMGTYKKVDVNPSTIRSRQHRTHFIRCIKNF